MEQDSNRTSSQGRARTLWHRLFWLEYVPMAALIATWALVGLVEGVRDMALLLASFIFVGAARTLAWVNVRLPLRRRLSAGQVIAPGTWRSMWLCELASTACGLLLVVLGSRFAANSGYAAMSLPLLIIGCGLPARNIGPLLARASREGRPLAYVLARGLGSVALIAAAIAFSDDSRFMPAALAAREWLGFLVLLAMPWPPVSTSDAAPAPAVGFAEVAGATRATSHGQLGYRIGKVLFSVLGPFGTATARTLRGLGVFGRLEAGRAGSRWVTASAAIIAGTAAAGLLAIGDGGIVHLVAAAGAARIAAAAASALVWSLAPLPDIEWARDDEFDGDD